VRAARTRLKQQYALVRRWLATDGQEVLDKSAAMQARKLSRTAFVKRGTAAYDRRYRDAALAGLGVVCLADCKPALQKIAEDETASGRFAARAALLRLVAPSNPPAMDCVNMQTMAPQSFAGPTFVLGPIEFTNPTLGGSPDHIDVVDRIEARDGKPEMSVGFSQSVTGRTPLLATFVQAKFPQGVGAVVVDVQHWARPLIVEALNPSGNVVGTATQAAQNQRVKLTLAAPGISALRFEAVEAHLYEMCWERP
jgi:hypothetical protein